MMLTEKDGTIVRVNPAFTKVTGYSPDEIIGQTPSVFAVRKTRPNYLKKNVGRNQRKWILARSDME
jgi:PAS domain S-box-containing protein